MCSDTATTSTARTPPTFSGLSTLVDSHEGRRVRYTLADVDLARALRELAQVVRAVDTAEPCLDDPNRTRLRAGE